jgi:hypothetical protein
MVAYLAQPACWRVAGEPVPVEVERGHAPALGKARWDGPREAVGAEVEVHQISDFLSVLKSRPMSPTNELLRRLSTQSQRHRESVAGSSTESWLQDAQSSWRPVSPWHTHVRQVAARRRH